MKQITIPTTTETANQAPVNQAPVNQAPVNQAPRGSVMGSQLTDSDGIVTDIAPNIALVTSTGKLKASDMPKGLSTEEAIKWKNSHNISLNKTESFFLINQLLTEQTPPNIASMLIDAFKPKEGIAGIGAKNWSIRIAQLIGGKEVDCARFIEGIGWYYTPINNETLKADKKSPINSNGGLKALASTVNFYAGIAEDFKESLVNKMISSSATNEEIALIPSLTVKNADSVKDATGTVIKSKFDVQLELVQSVFAQPLQFEFRGATVETKGFNDKFAEYKLSNQTDAYFLGADKQTAYDALLTMGFTADALKTEED